MGQRSNNYLDRSRRWWLAAALGLAPGPLRGQVAILESVAGGKREGVLRFRFRTGPAAKLQVGKATLLLHVAEGKPPAALEILKPMKGSAAVQIQREGWVTVLLSPKCAQRLVDEDAWLEIRAPEQVSVHLPSQPGYAPYLVVEGK
jgi:hypothetical protein